ncbi:MAG: ribonuclease E/G, partial [Alphaproteobacteria bacterium]|nr:ribonuclease E/G [Alphaproteobacteria bacterium]
EETALKTNLEAADEVARQLRLRDLGGLVVIDFIDMEDRRNNGKVERKMRDALSGDRARIQMGRISSFGLMELSRQRLSASLSESQFETCPGCQGAGRIRTADAASIMVLRAIEAEGIKGRASQVIVQVSNEVALYILNNKRDNLAVIEERYGFAVLIRVDDTLGASGFRVEVSKPIDKTEDDSDDTPAGEDDQDGNNRRDGRRRGRRGGRNRSGRNQIRKDDDNAGEEQADQKSQDAIAQDDSKTDEKASQEKKKPSASTTATVDTAAKKTAPKKAELKEEEPAGKDNKKSGPKKAPAKKAKKSDAQVEPKDEKPAKVVKVSNDDAKPKKVALKAKKDDAPKDYETVNEAPKAKKKGWWNLK